MNNSEHQNTAVWDQYARCHVSVLTSYQWALFKEAVAFLTGDVVDCGCGTARLAPLLAEQTKVSSYTGIDYSPEMVRLAKQVTTSKLSIKPFKILQDKIENISGEFDSAVSIHSYYTWPNPEQVLSSIYRMLRTESHFVLVTPNPKIDMKKLLDEVEKELFGHPDFPAFRQFNLMLSDNCSAKFVTMDALIDETRRIGFKVEECHQRHYLGGVNFIVLKK